MKGIKFLILSLVGTYILSKTTNLKPLNNYNDKFEYIPIITSNIYADLLIILITFSQVLGNDKSWKILTHWYKKYRLSAMIADILAGVLYLLVSRYIDHYYDLKLDLFQFTVLSVIVQIILDYLFYLVFSSIPKGQNDMLDLFKDWAKHAKLNAIWGDSLLIVVGVILSAILNKQSFDTNIFVLILGLYLVPYFIYMKD